MRNISRISLVAAASAVLVASMVIPASADTGESTVSGGDLTFTTFGATLTGVTLDGANQTATGTSSSAWSIKDARGTGAAWALSVTASTPTSAAGSVVTETAKTLPVGGLIITPGTITEGAGSDGPGNITADPGTMTGSSQVLVSATGTSKGTYSLTPTYSLSVPANAYRSNYSGAVGTTPLNPYISTITYTIA